MFVLSGLKFTRIIRRFAASDTSKIAFNLERFSGLICSIPGKPVTCIKPRSPADAFIAASTASRATEGGPNSGAMSTTGGMAYCVTTASPAFVQPTMLSG